MCNVAVIIRETLIVRGPQTTPLRPIHMMRGFGRGAHSNGRRGTGHRYQYQLVRGESAATTVNMYPSEPADDEEEKGKVLEPTTNVLSAPSSDAGSDSQPSNSCITTLLQHYTSGLRLFCNGVPITISQAYRIGTRMYPCT